MTAGSGEPLRTPKPSVQTIRPRRGDLESATQPHTFQPSGEHAGASWVEVCDLCGLAQRTNRIHPEQVLKKGLSK